MESPYNGRDNAPTRHLMPLSKSPGVRNSLHYIEPLAKGVPKTHPNIIGYCL